MNQFRTHLQQRISELNTAFEDYKKLESETKNEDMATAYNALASATFDMKCEYEKLLELYNVHHQAQPVDGLDLMF